ncbi:MAG TPA: YbhB/YbcL family Raf kinase inhibitor-like protein [Candidatus Paceibacterota bacterium]|nr:YbhB/YbcL family Raf kinase inhibitor-like protein [Candidatus Paceibacterota bacterium]
MLFSKRIIWGGLIILAVFAVIGEWYIKEPAANSNHEPPQSSSTMIITSPAFEDGGIIPKKYTCDGGDINPELQIHYVPREARSLALILHDPDVPMPGGFTHWVVWNISPETTLIKDESVPPDAVEGRNSAGRIGYMGPCPPSGTHHYHFQLYALNDVLDIPATSSLEEIQKQIDEHLVAKADLVGLYAR